MEDLVAEWNSSHATKLHPSRDPLALALLGNNEELWQFVHNLLSMKKCAQNLEQASDTDNIKRLKQRRNQLLSESQSLKIATKQLMSDIKLLEKTTFDLKKKNNETLGKIQDMTFKVQMMKAKSLQCIEETRMIDGYSVKLEKISVDRINVDPTSRHGNKSKAESVCTKEIQSHCTALYKEGSDISKDKKQARLARVEPLLFHHPPDNIMKAFIAITQQATAELSQLNRSEKIFPDHDKQQTKLQAIDKHIQEVQIHHIVKSQKLLKTKNSLANAQRELSHLMQTWKELIMANYPDSEDRTLLINWFQLDLEQNGYEAALRELDLICNGMNHLCKERREMVDDLKTKNSQMQQFRGIVEEKQRKIHSIIKHNSAAKERLGTQQIEIQKYIDQKIQPLDNMSVLVANLKDQLLREVLLFASYTKPRPNLSQRYDVDSNAMKTVFKCPEYFLVELMDKLRTDHFLTQSCDQFKMDVERMSHVAVDPEGAHAVLNESERFTERHEKSFSNELERILTQASKGVASVSEVQSVLEEWWYQPAQTLVGWKTVEDMTGSQWVEQWRLLVTKYMTLVPEHLHLEDV